MLSSSVPKHIQALTQDTKGRIWVGTTEGLYIFDQKQTHPLTTKNGLPDNSIQSLFAEKNGSVWIGTQKGLCRWQEKPGRAFAISAFAENHPLSTVSVTAMFEDREATLWIGTASNGLHRLHLGNIRVFPEILPSGRENITAVAEASSGTVFMGTTKGAAAYHPKNPSLSVSIKGIRETVYSLLSDGARGLWLGGANGLQYLPFSERQRFDSESLSKLSPLPPICPSTVILSLSKDSVHRLWIGSQNNGLFCLENGIVTRPKEVESLEREIISALTTTKKGILWIGTWNNGVWFLDNGVCKHLTALDGIKELQIVSLLEDSEGTLWIGTFGSGIYRFKNGIIKRVSVIDGLANNVAYTLLEDMKGYLWASYNKGIFRVPIRDMNACADGKKKRLVCDVFGTEEGMISSECNGGTQPVGWRCRDGRLLFATIRGVAEIQPDSLFRNTLSPTVIIEELRADSITFFCNQSRATTFEIPTNVQRCEFSFTATSLRVPSNIRFRYMLEGYENMWTEATERRTASYTNLPRGRNYRFRVVACNNDGVWNWEGASITLTLQQYFWETWWAISVYAILVVGGLWQMLRIRERLQRRQLREKFREREAELIVEKNHVLEEANMRLSHLNDQLSEANANLSQLNEEKIDILGVVAHDLKNPVIGIQKMAYSLEVKAKRLENSELQESASIIKRTSERMFTMIQQLLKVHAAEYGKESLLPTTIAVNELAQQLQHDWRQRAQLRSIKIRVYAPDERITAFADPFAFLQILENLLSNALKASKAGAVVEVHCRSEADKTFISVKDEGIGMSEEQQKILFTKFILLRGEAQVGMPSDDYSTGLGLYIVKKLTDAMHGEISCQSSPNQGSIFTLILPRTNPMLSQH